MRKDSASQSGVFNPRVFVAFSLCFAGVLMAMLSFAATPPSGMTSLSANSPGGSPFFDKPAGQLNGNAKEAVPGMPLAPAAARWAIVTSPNPNGAQYNLLNGVTCISASDCWAVGYSAGTSFQTLIERWNGTSWAIVNSPNSSATQFNFLNDVSCVSASDCWAVGYYQSGLLSTRTLIQHWDGTSWAIVTSPDATATRQNYLNSVTCVSSSSCWAVGYYQINDTTFQTLIERWDGTSWAIVTSPNSNPARTNLLSDVTCLSASDCWAVGYYDASSSTSNAYQTLIERWNGSLWTIINSPDTISAQDNILFGVTCASPSECWAVGHSRLAIASRPLIVRWDGTAWAIVSSPTSSPTQNNYLFTVTCSSGSDCWAIGYYDAGSIIAGPRYQTLIQRWNGTSWALATSPNTSDTQDNFLFGVTCVSASDCWAVGYYVGADGKQQTLTEHYAVPPVQLISVLSRKVHGSAGTFDVELPLTNPAGIECRSGGANGNYTLVFTFANTLTGVGGASVTSGTGSVSSSAIGTDAHQYIVDLSGVGNAQYLTVSLTNVTDSAENSSSAVSATMGVLVGDVNASGVVTSGDTNLCKAQALQPVTSANFRNDINASGSITTGDVNIIKQNALSHL